MKQTDTIEISLERTLGLPVVATPSGTAVLDRMASRAEILKEEETRELLAGSRNKTRQSARTNQTNAKGWARISPLRRRRRHGRSTRTDVRLYLRLSRPNRNSVIVALNSVASGAAAISNIDAIVDTGLSGFQWLRVLEIVEILARLRGKLDIPLNISIRVPFSCPSEAQMDFLARHRVIVQYILGCGLGHSGKLGAREASVLSTASDYGLRVPVLFYWCDEDKHTVENTLKRALELNKHSGVGLLPTFVSPSFCLDRAQVPADGARFSDMMDAFYTDRVFGEFMEEPISDLENRMAECNTRRRIQALVTDEGRIVPFRAFPFAALDGRSHRTSTTASFPLASGRRYLAMYGQCKTCAWKHLCGGLDTNRSMPVPTYRSIANSWCTWRKILMQRIITECFAVKDCMQTQFDELRI